MKRFLFSILTLCILFVAGYHVISLWRNITLYQTTPSKENLLKATRLSRHNPDPFYRLGVFYQWDIRNTDLKESQRYLWKSIERNPLEQAYWLDLAKVYQRMEEKDAFRYAVNNAVLVFPTGYRGRWVSGNLLLRHGDLENALQHFSYILTHYPDESSLIYEVLGKVINDPEFILERLVPKDPSSFKLYLSYLYKTDDKESVKRAWERKASYGIKTDRTGTLRHIEFLIAHGDLSEAFQVWKDRLREEGLTIPSDGNLITNGGFENEEILGGGFDWKIGNVPGAQVSFDHSTALEGKSSLKIVFDGKKNIAFHHVYQYVALKPSTDYVLKAHMKTEAVTTKSGIRIEISGIGPAAFHGTSESLIGDNAWKELTVTFRTPPQSQGGLVRIRREKTDKFDRFISGVVWIDNIRLTEKR